MWTFQIRPTDTQVSHEHVNVAWTSNLTLFCNTGGDATSLYLTGNTIQNHCKAPCQHLLTVNPPIGYNIAKRVWTLFAPFCWSLTHTNVFFCAGKARHDASWSIGLVHQDHAAHTGCRRLFLVSTWHRGVGLVLGLVGKVLSNKRKQEVVQCHKWWT